MPTNRNITTSATSLRTSGSFIATLRLRNATRCRPFHAAATEGATEPPEDQTLNLASGFGGKQFQPTINAERFDASRARAGWKTCSTWGRFSNLPVGVGEHHLRTIVDML